MQIDDSKLDSFGPLKDFVSASKTNFLSSLYFFNFSKVAALYVGSVGSGYSSKSF